MYGSTKLGYCFIFKIIHPIPSFETLLERASFLMDMFFLLFPVTDSAKYYFLFYLVNMSDRAMWFIDYLKTTN